MGFLSPLNLLWLAGSLGALVFIYLRQRARTTIEVSSLMLFDTVGAPVIKRRMLKLDLTFWLEAAALIALSIAMAGLFIDRPAPPTPRLARALVFDLGAAMGARDGHGTRLDAARSAARSIIARSPAGERFSIIGYALQPVLMQAETANRGALDSALSRLAPLATPARPAALRAALMRLRDTGGIDLFTDRPPAATALGDLGDLIDPARLVVHRVGVTAPNLAIVSLDPGDPGVSQGHCLMRNFADRSVGATLIVETDRGDVFRTPLIAEPDSEDVVAFGPLHGGGLVHASISSRDDALPADNDRWAYIAPGDVRGRALVLSPDPAVRDDLSRILVGVDPALNVTAMAPGSFSAPRPGDAPYDIAIMHDSFIPSVRANASLLVFPPPPGEDGLTVGTTVPSAELMYHRDQGDQGDQGYHGDHLDQVDRATSTTGEALTIDQVREITLPPSVEVTVRSAGDSAAGPLTMAAFGHDAQGRIAIVAFDVRNHMLINPDNLPALLVTIDLLKRLTEPADLKIVRTGDWVTVAASARGATLVAPDGAQTPLSVGSAGVVGFQPLEAGRYQVRTGDATTAVYANYFDEDESNLAIETTADMPPAHPFPAAAADAVMPPASTISTLDGLLVALAIAALLAETFILMRDALPRRRLGHVL